MRVVFSKFATINTSVKIEASEHTSGLKIPARKKLVIQESNAIEERHYQRRDKAQCVCYEDAL